MSCYLEKVQNFQISYFLGQSQFAPIVIQYIFKNRFY